MPRVLVPVAKGSEETEAVTIIDLLRRAGAEVVVAGLNGAIPTTLSRGVVLVPDKPLGEAVHESFDMVILPGGQPGADNLKASLPLRDFLKTMAARGHWVAAICAAPLVLAAAGLLDNKRATSFPKALEGLDIPGLVYLEDPVVVDGKMVTSRGPGTAMDFALVLIEVLMGKEARDKVEGPLIRVK